MSIAGRKRNVRRYVPSCCTARQVCFAHARILHKWHSISTAAVLPPTKTTVPTIVDDNNYLSAQVGYSWRWNFLILYSLHGRRRRWRIRSEMRKVKICPEAQSIVVVVCHRFLKILYRYCRRGYSVVFTDKWWPNFIPP